MMLALLTCSCNTCQPASASCPAARPGRLVPLHAWLLCHSQHHAHLRSATAVWQHVTMRPPGNSQVQLTRWQAVCSPLLAHNTTSAPQQQGLQRRIAC